MFEIPTIHCAALGMSGFGDSMAPTTIGICHRRATDPRLPLAVFIQENGAEQTVGVYIGLHEYEADADDQSMFRQYTYICNGTADVTPTLQALGILNSLQTLVQGKTAAELDRMLCRGWNFTREAI